MAHKDIHFFCLNLVLISLTMQSRQKREGKSVGSEVLPMYPSSTFS